MGTTEQPPYITKAAEYTDEIAPSPRKAAEWAALYHWRKHPSGIVLGKGADQEIVDVYENEREAKKLRDKLKEYIEASGEPIEVEGLPPLVLQHPTSETVDVMALGENNPPVLARALALGLLRFDMKALDAAEKAGLITGVPRMPLGGEPRLVFLKERGK